MRIRKLALLRMRMRVRVRMWVCLPVLRTRGTVSMRAHAPSRILMGTEAPMHAHTCLRAWRRMYVSMRPYVCRLFLIFIYMHMHMHIQIHIHIHIHIHIQIHRHLGSPTRRVRTWGMCGIRAAYVRHTCGIRAAYVRQVSP
jgi:hypothetical protein